MKKYEFIWETKKLNESDNVIVRRIRALVTSGNVKDGQIGGWIEKEENLSENKNDNAWVYDDAAIIGNAIVCGNTKVYGNAEIYGDVLR